MNNPLDEKLILRPANEKDDVLLFEWANDPAVRKWSFINSRPIELDVHRKWFNKKMDDTDIRIWIMEKQNLPCGQIRVEKSDNRAVLHYSIASDFRGENLGTKMLKLAVKKSCNEWKGIEILAYTVPKNIASSKSLEKAGFKLKSSGRKGNCFIYKRN